eukprot:tig00021373_g21078.t1
MQAADSTSASREESSEAVDVGRKGGSAALSSQDKGCIEQDDPGPGASCRPEDRCAIDDSAACPSFSQRTPTSADGWAHVPASPALGGASSALAKRSLAALFPNVPAIAAETPVRAFGSPVGASSAPDASVSAGSVPSPLAPFSAEASQTLSLAPPAPLPEPGAAAAAAARPTSTAPQPQPPATVSRGATSGSGVARKYSAFTPLEDETIVAVAVPRLYGRALEIGAIHPGGARSMTALFEGALAQEPRVAAILSGRTVSSILGRLHRIAGGHLFLDAVMRCHGNAKGGGFGPLRREEASAAACLLRPERGATPGAPPLPGAPRTGGRGGARLSALGRPARGARAYVPGAGRPRLLPRPAPTGLQLGGARPAPTFVPGPPAARGGVDVGAGGLQLGRGPAPVPRLLCEFCAAAFASPQEADAHSRVAHPWGSRCGFCGAPLASESDCCTPPRCPGSGAARPGHGPQPAPPAPAPAPAVTTWRHPSAAAAAAAPAPEPLGPAVADFAALSVARAIVQHGVQLGALPCAYPPAPGAPAVAVRCSFRPGFTIVHAAALAIQNNPLLGTIWTPAGLAAEMLAPSCSALLLARTTVFLLASAADLAQHAARRAGGGPPGPGRPGAGARRFPFGPSGARGWARPVPAPAPAPLPGAAAAAAAGDLLLLLPQPPLRPLPVPGATPVPEAERGAAGAGPRPPAFAPLAPGVPPPPPF